MIDLKALKDYLPILTAFLGALLAYIFNNRKYKLERFHSEAVESLKEFYSPVFHEMRLLKLEISSDNKAELLNNFITKFVSADTILYKSYNENLINLFYDLDEALREYNLKKERKILDNSEKLFNNIYYLVKKEYFSIQKSLYRQYPWYKYLNNKNYILKSLMDIGVLFYDTVLFLGLCWVFLLYIMIVNKIIGKNDIPNIIIRNFPVFTAIMIGLYCFAFIVRLPYFFVVMDYRKQSRILDKIDKIIWSNVVKGVKKIIDLTMNFRKILMNIINKFI